MVEDLRDPCGLGARFLYWQASTRYHHVYEGGLAIHSLDVAKALFIHPNIRPERREIMAVAGLVHDIGKLWTYDRDGRLTPTGKQLCHEQVNLEVLAPTLSKLDQRDPRLTAELRAAIPRGIGLKRGTLTVEEDFLRSADRTSAKSDQPDRYYPLPAAV